MPVQNPYVPNTPLSLAKNLRFNDVNGIPVTQLLPVGTPDSPTTGYISCIGAYSSKLGDLYTAVSATLQQYNQEITILQQQVTALQASGTTIPVVNGYCFTGNANSPITTVVPLVAQSLCSYIAVLGTTSQLTLAILAEGASTLNALPAFSQNSVMSGLTGWISSPLINF